jgi:hypothetical protein
MTTTTNLNGGRSHARRRGARRLGLPATIGAAALLLTACTTGAGPTAASQVKKDWIAFFSASTPPARRAMLLENGKQMASVLRRVDSSTLARSVSVTVSKVRVTSPTTATVTFDVLLGGMPVLNGQPGTAVKQGGTWKVSLQSFCGLLSLEHVQVPGCASAGGGFPGAPGTSGPTGAS